MAETDTSEFFRKEGINYFEYKMLFEAIIEYYADFDIEKLLEQIKFSCNSSGFNVIVPFEFANDFKGIVKNNNHFKFDDSYPFGLTITSIASFLDFLVSIKAYYLETEFNEKEYRDLFSAVIKKIVMVVDKDYTICDHMQGNDKFNMGIETTKEFSSGIRFRNLIDEFDRYAFIPLNINYDDDNWFDDSDDYFDETEIRAELGAGKCCRLSMVDENKGIKAKYNRYPFGFKIEFEIKLNSSETIRALHYYNIHGSKDRIGEFIALEYYCNGLMIESKRYNITEGLFGKTYGKMEPISEDMIGTICGELQDIITRIKNSYPKKNKQKIIG